VLETGARTEEILDAVHGAVVKVWATGTHRGQAGR
jgi:hypothetical protein